MAFMLLEEGDLISIGRRMKIYAPIPIYKGNHGEPFGSITLPFKVGDKITVKTLKRLHITCPLLPENFEYDTKSFLGKYRVNLAIFEEPAQTELFPTIRNFSYQVTCVKIDKPLTSIYFYQTGPNSNGSDKFSLSKNDS